MLSSLASFMLSLCFPAGQVGVAGGSPFADMQGESRRGAQAPVQDVEREVTSRRVTGQRIPRTHTPPLSCSSSA